MCDVMDLASTSQNGGGNNTGEVFIGEKIRQIAEGERTVKEFLALEEKQNG